MWCGRLAHRPKMTARNGWKRWAQKIGFGEFPEFNDGARAMRGVCGAYFCYPIGPENSWQATPISLMR